MYRALSRKVISSNQPPEDMKTKYMECSRPTILIPWINISLTIKVTRSVKASQSG